MSNLKVFVFGKEIDSDSEFELCVGDSFGLDITLKYTEEHFNGVEETRHNCTEFHHLYNKETYGTDFPEELSSAFESDIHHTGGTKRVSYLEWIKVERATILHEEY